ncbi:hypothetical protein [Methylophaga nitratireducenticrescens]|jgi:hypothetical protein|uniref:hypothetical protein n=1 Tax=Methylophaga nitratireducenticrescens TaxID=754476 RepID=UPI000CDCCB91|nr:hypothetical protein [Methylophaga nitratireducenticrescens]AUZ85136.1 hypothetical protein CDW43_11405 [Methylophaga nitratireducenticrescens]
MAIKSSTFGRVELSGEEAARFIRHMKEDKPNPLAQASLEAGRRLRRESKNKEVVRLSLKLSHGR